MEQKRIMEILVELSELKQKLRLITDGDPDRMVDQFSADKRRGKIHDHFLALSEELKEGFPKELAVGASGTELVHGLFQTLLYSTFESRPEHLPQLFPFFAALCSDKNKYLGSAPVPIDWSLLPPA